MKTQERIKQTPFASPREYSFQGLSRTRLICYHRQRVCGRRICNRFSINLIRNHHPQTKRYFEGSAEGCLVKGSSPITCKTTFRRPRKTNSRTIQEVWNHASCRRLTTNRLQNERFRTHHPKRRFGTHHFITT